MRTRPAVLGLSAALLLCPACKPGGSAAPRQRPPPSVTVAPVAVRDVAVEIDGPVDLRPITALDVSSKTLGYLDAVLVFRGDRVRKGQLLALVRPADLPDQLAAARGSLAQAEASAGLARANLERAERLAPTGVVSQQELQSATTARAQAEALLSSAQANVAALATRLGETRIESPLDGVVTARRLDPGALVGPATGPIVALEQTELLRAFVRVNESQGPLLRLGQEAKVTLEATPGRVFGGKVVRISPGLDPVARTLDAEVHVRNPGDLRSGMYGRCRIAVGLHPKAILVPALAVQISDDVRYAYVLRGDKVARVRVEIGVDDGDELEVTKGLSPGDEVVTAGADVVSDGTVVRAVRGANPYTGRAANGGAGGAPAPAAAPAAAAPAR